MKNKIFFLAVIILAIFLRFDRLGNNPPSLTWDEAAWGYNAYSLSKDLKDEFGRFLPLDYLESFGDFKPPTYAYLSIIPVKLFGLNEFSTRFASSFFGIMTVLITFFLTERIFQESKNKKLYAIFASFFLAISPWHIMLSRAAFEANIASFFMVTGIWLFLKSIESRGWLLLLSLFSFVISLYTFNTARIVSPLILIVLIFLFRKRFFKIRREFFIAAVLSIVLLLPTLRFVFSTQASLRFKEVNIFSDTGPIATSNTEIDNDHNSFWSKAIHNRRAIFAVEYLKHYFDNLSPDFLFIKGDGNPKFSTQDVGELYLWDLPFFIVGLFLLFKKKEGSWILLPLWILIGIAPAAVARETPHALRIETTLPTFQILVAYGFVNLISNLKSGHRLLWIKISNLQFKYLIFFLSFLLFLNFLYFYHGLQTHYAKEFSGEWQYGYKDSIKYVSSVENNFNRINITEDLGRPYIYYLFYKKVDPREFRKTVKIKKESLGFVEVLGFGKYRFAKDPNKISKRKDDLFINLPNRIPQKAYVHKIFYLLNGEKVLVAYTL